MEKQSMRGSRLESDSTDPNSATFEMTSLDALREIPRENSLDASVNRESKTDMDRAEDWKRENGYRWDSSPWGEGDSR
jgi:hypothetical protein